MAGTRWRRTVRAMPVLLVVLLALGLLNAGEAGPERPVRQPVGTGAMVLIAAPTLADVVAGARFPEQVLGRPDRTVLTAIPTVPGVLVAALLHAGRASWWQPSLWVALALAVAGVLGWRGRAPPLGVVDAFRSRAARH